MKFLCKKIVAIVLVLSMIFSTSGMSTFANSVDDVVETEVVNEEAIEELVEENHLDGVVEEEEEEETETSSNEVVVDETEKTLDSVDEEKETVKLTEENEKEDESESETEVVAETTTSTEEESQNLTQDETSVNEEIATASDAEEVVEETTAASEELVATVSEVEEVVETAELNLATKSDAFLFSVTNIISKHDDTWKELTQENIGDLDEKKYTKFYLAEDVMLTKYNYGYRNDDEIVTICLHGHQVLFNNNVDLSELGKYIEFVDCGGGEEDKSHNEFWSAINQTGFLGYGEFPKGKLYLSDDVILRGTYQQSMVSDTTICLHGHKLTIDSSFNMNMLQKNLTFTNCYNDKCDLVNLGNFKYGSASSVRVTFENLNIVSNQKLDVCSRTIFDNCSFEITTKESVAFEIKSRVNVEFKNLEFNNSSAGFLIDDSSTVDFENVNMKNNTAEPLFTIKNKSVVNVKGTGIYEGNKSIYDLYDSKLNVIDGSGNARDTLRQPASTEYYEAVVTKKGTKLLSPDAPGLNIVYKKNVGKHIIRSFNSETVFDGVIIANQFVGAETVIGAYIAAGQDKSKLTLINRAYVNQNRRNILVNDVSDIYGSITHKDGTFDTLDRDATLSFYPVRPEMTIMKNVIKKNENSLLLTPRNLKTDDEWETLIADYIYKACMIDGQANDLYEYETMDESHPAASSWVLCDIEDREDGLQQGTFKLGKKDFKTVTLRLHLGDGKYYGSGFSTIDSFKEINVKDPYSYEGDTVELYWRPFLKANNYQNTFADTFKGMLIKWVDNTVPGKPYEYKLEGWALTPEHLVTNRVQPAATTQLGETVEKSVDAIIFNKWEKYHYKDVIDLYACWVGNLKLKLVFDVDSKMRDETFPVPIDYFERKEIWGREGQPTVIPEYTSPKDYLYDGFELTGWREIYYSQTQQTSDYSVEFMSQLLEVESEYVPGDHTEMEDGGYLLFNAEFRGDEEHKINWCLNSSSIKRVNNNVIKLNEDGFYVENVKLGEPYSILKPELNDSITSTRLTFFEIEENLEFLGWTKQVITEPVNADDLINIAFVRDYVKGYATRGDAYYYPVFLRSELNPQHTGYNVLTGGKLNADGPLEGGLYHLNNNVNLLTAKEIVGNVTIDLHGKELIFDPGAFFYSSYDVVFTDCKYNEPEKRDRGKIYNANGVIFEGTGALKFEKVALSGKQAYNFLDLEKEVIMDQVDIRQIDWVGIMHDPDKEDTYPRNMQLENSKLHIKNSTIQNLTGMIYVMDGSHLTLTNITMVNNGMPGAELDNGGIFRVLNSSKMTINSPAYFEKNQDIFYIVDSNLELNSEVDHYDGDIEAVKDKAIIFNKNGRQALGYLTGADVKASGIFINNPVRAGIFLDYDGRFSSKNGTRLHYDGYIYVRGNNTVGGYGGDVFVNGNDILYYQNDSDRINTNSVLDIYTYYSNPLYFTNCDPDVCRDVYIIGNLSNEEKEAFDKNRDEYGNIKNFKLMNDTSLGYVSGLYYAVIDGVHYDNENNRGWDIVYNKRQEQKVIDINFKMMYNTLGRFYDMNGNIVRETTVQLDRNDPEEFNKWFNNLASNYIPIDSTGRKLNRKLGKLYRRTLHPKTKCEELLRELDFDIYKSADYLHIEIGEESTEVVQEEPRQYTYSEYDVSYNPYPDDFDIVQSEGSTYILTIDGESWSWNNEAKNIPKDVDHVVRSAGVKQTYLKVVGGDYERYTDMFPYEFKGWKVSGHEDVLLQPGMKINFPREFGSQMSYYLHGVWEPRKMKINFMTNDYVKYKHTPNGDYSVEVSIGDRIKIPKVADLDIDPDMVFFGWVTEEEHSRFTINGVKLPQDMYYRKFAEEKVTLRLGSTYKVVKYLKYFNIYPLFFPKNDTILNNIINNQKMKSERLMFRLKSIGELDATVENLHIDHEVQNAEFFTKESDMTKSICLYEDTNFTGTVNVDGDLRLCLHAKNFTVNGGKFNLLDNSKLTICNCEDNGVVTISNSDFVTNSKKVIFDGVKVKSNNVLTFDNKNIDFVDVTFTDVSGNAFVNATNKSQISFVNSTFDNINISGNYFVNASGEAQVNFERMTFDGLAKGFYYDNAEGLFNGVSVKNSTANVLFTLNNEAKVNLKQYSGSEGTVYSYFENNKNIALVDNSKFMVSGGSILDTQNDILLTDISGNPTRDNKGGLEPVVKTDIELLDSTANPINESRLQRVVFKGNTGNYLFGAKNNAKVFFNGIALKNTFTESNGKMGVYVNLGGNNTLVLRANPYINQNNRNIVVTSNDYITSETDESEYVSAGQALSPEATLSFYLTEHKYQRILVGANDASAAQIQGGNFAKLNYTVIFEDGSVRKNYLYAACMIEGHRDDIFTQYGNNYAGNNMRIVYGQAQDGSSDFGFFAEPYEEKETISIKLNANGGKFKDPSGSDVTTSYTFTYRRSRPDDNIRNWFNSLVPTAVDTRDNFEGTFKGWSRLSDALKGMTISEILEYEADLELFAFFDYPTLLTLKFSAEKNNNTKLKGKAYDSFDTKTVYVRLTNNNYTGNVVAPAIDVTPKNGYTISNKWETDDTSFNKYLEPRVNTIFQNVTNTTEFNYYLVWTEPEISIKINSQSGIFSDPTGKVVNKNESYTVKFKKYASEDNLTNWLKKLAPKAIDTKDNYEVVATKFVDVNDSTKVYTTEQLLALTQSTEVNPVYEFPTIYTAVFRAEKGGASSLKGKAYNAFNPITKYVRLTESENTKGILTSPDSSVVTLKGGYTTDYVWKAENSAYSNVKAGEALTVGQMSIANDTMYFYLSFTAPAPDPQPVYNGGGGGGGGGGSSASVPATDNAAVNQAQAQAPSQPQEPAAVPSNSNPFGVEVVTNSLGVAQQLTAAETGLMQMAKAHAVMQQALANPTAAPTKVSETSVKASEANWTKGADGLWSLSTANSEPIKDTWQKVEVANGKEGWYKFDANGKMQTGWVADGNKVFFLIETGTNQGQMVRNTTVNIGGFEFKFAADGSLETMGAKA